MRKVKNRLRMAFLFGLVTLLFCGSTIAQEYPDKAKDSIEQVTLAEVPQPIQLEKKEAYKLDDAEYKSAVATRFSLVGDFSGGIIGAALLGLVLLFVNLFRKFKHVITFRNTVAFGLVVCMVLGLLLFQEEPTGHAMALMPAFGVDGKNLSQELKRLKEERQGLLASMDGLINKAEKESRTLNSQEEGIYKSLQTSCENLTQQVNLHQEELDKVLRSLSKNGKVLSSADFDNASIDMTEDESQSRTFEIFKRAEKRTNKPISDWYLRNYDVNERVQRSSVYSVLKAMGSGKSDNRNTEAAMAELRSVNGGGSLLNPFLSAQLFDGGLSKSHLAAAGMKVAMMESDSHKFAKVTSYPVFEWAAENASTTAKDLTLASVTLSAKTFRGFVPVSGELIQSGLNTNQVLEEIFNRAAGNAIDTAGLIGSGTGAEPKGIKNYANVNVHSMGTNGAAITNYDPYVDATKLILEDNGEIPTAAIMAPRTWATQAKFKENGIYQLPPPVFKDFKMFQTSKIAINETQGTETDASSVYLGGFDSLYMGVLLNTTVIVTPVVAETFQYNFFLAQRIDFQPEREENFAIIKGIIPA